MNNWMTSLAGVGALLTSVGGMVSGFSTGHVDPTAISSLIAGIGLLFAKDFNTTGGTPSKPASKV